MSGDRSRVMKVNTDVETAYNRIREIPDLGDPVFQDFQMFGNSGFGLLVSEKYGWRTNADVALVVLVTGDGRGAEVTFTVAGGAEGLLRFDWGLHGSLLNKIEKELMEEFPNP